MAVYVERNLAPIFGENPDYPNTPGASQYIRDNDFSDELLREGAKPYFVIYDGTLNRARLWSNDDGTLMANIPTTGGPFDWTREDQNNNDPPKKNQVQACARLALTPQASGCKLNPGVLLMFDIEACRTLNFSAIDPPEKWQAAIHLASDMAAWVREVNPRSPILSFGLPIMACVTGPDTPNVVSLDSHYLQELRSAFTGAAICAYFPMWYPDWLNNPAGWFDFIDNVVRDGDRYFSGFPRYAVVSPTYWSFSADHSKDGQPLPLDLWREMLAYLHQKRFEIVVWLGGKSIKQIGRDHLDALKTYVG